MKLNFYDVDEDYLKYLQNVDNKIPNIVTEGDTKFFCGVLFEINEFKYLVPVTSFKNEQKTNLLIKRSSGETMGSLRFSFMIPVTENVIKIRDFKTMDKKKAELLSTELQACRKMENKIVEKALEIYKIGNDEKHWLNHACCNFLKLEEAAREYSKMSVV